MFTLPEEDEQLTTTEKVYFFMPTGEKGEFVVTYNFYDDVAYRELLSDSGKNDLEKQATKFSFQIEKAKENQMSEEEIEAMLDIKFEEETLNVVTSILEEAIVDMTGIFDKNGKPVPYSKEILPRIIKYKQPRIALINAFYDIHSEDGRKKAKRKN